MTVSGYISSRMEELIEKGEEGYSDNLSLVVDEVKEKFNTQCTYSYCGGFDSPGYDVDCYAIAFIDSEGKLDMITYQDERY